MDNPKSGLTALQRDGIDLGEPEYPLRRDTVPRAVWPAGLTHLRDAQLVLDGEEETDRCEHLSLGVRAHNDAMGRL